MADVNVTPMVDVMLVIFMVTAPLLAAGIPIDFPKTAAHPLPQPKKPLLVTLAADENLSIRDERADAISLVPRLLALNGLEGNAAAPGYRQISLVCQPQRAKTAGAVPQADAAIGA